MILSDVSRNVACAAEAHVRSLLAFLFFNYFVYMIILVSIRRKGSVMEVSVHMCNATSTDDKRE